MRCLGGAWRRAGVDLALAPQVLLLIQIDRNSGVMLVFPGQYIVFKKLEAIQLPLSPQGVGFTVLLGLLPQEPAQCIPLVAEPTRDLGCCKRQRQATVTLHVSGESKGEYFIIGSN